MFQTLSAGKTSQVVAGTGAAGTGDRDARPGDAALR